MVVVITGAAGFIGSNLSEYYLKQNIPVVGLDNFISGQPENISYLRTFPHFSFLENDILDLDAAGVKARVRELGQGKPVRLYHLACPASPPTYQKDPLNTLDVCYMGSRNVLILGKELNARVLLASTSEIYGDPQVHPQPESYRGWTNTVGPRSCYDEGKRSMETLGYIMREQHGMEVRIARIFNTYGPRMSPLDGRVITNFIHQGLKQQPLTIYGDGSQTRSFCFIEDLLRGIVGLMESKVTDPVNLGSEYEFKIIELAEIAKKLLASPHPFEYKPLPGDDPKQRRPDLTRARTLLGWEPRIRLEEGLSRMISWMREHVS